jgi:hypothetical protein
MCYNKEVSIGTYILGLAGCYNLYVNYNYKIEAIFFAWIVQMQLIEYVLWENQSCNDINKSTTKIGVLVNHTEPIVLWLAILFLSTKELPNYVNLLMIAFVIITIFYTKYVLDDNCTTVTPSSSPHLMWKWNYQDYFQIYYPFFLLCLNLLAINGIENGYYLAIIITLAFMISKIIYDKKKVIGAMWCFIAAFVPWAIPMIYESNMI